MFLPAVLNLTPLYCILSSSMDMLMQHIVNKFLIKVVIDCLEGYWLPNKALK